MRQYHSIILLTLVLTGISSAQNAYAPLTIQGLDQFVTSSARANGMGGSAIATGNDATVIFSNPSLLTNVGSLQIIVGGMYNSTTTDQYQDWHPNEDYAELSLVIEGTIANVLDTLPKKLNHAYDSITKDWVHPHTKTLPSALSIAMPFEISGITMSAGIGAAQAVSLTHYYQNNNGFDPNIGSFRPAPVSLPKSGDSVLVDWFQFIRQRDGEIYGITPGIAAELMEGLTLGVSATVYTGSSDDAQSRVERGIIHLKTNGSAGYNVLTIDSIYQHVATTGTSDYSGTNATVGLTYAEPNFTVSAVVTTPLELTRKWKSTVQFDSTGVSSTTQLSGSDKLSIPAQFSLGLAIRTSSKVTVGLDYVNHAYSNVDYTADSTLHPWQSSQFFRAGIEYKAAKWLAVRAGYREDVQIFVPAGTGLFDDPVRGSVYTLGAGFTYDNFQANISFEYGQTKYTDAWESNVNYNRIQSRTAMVELGYHF